MQKVVQGLVASNYLHPDARFSRDEYHRFKSDLSSREITVPKTTITPIMERFLFSCTSPLDVREVVVLGSYYAYATLWLAGGLMRRRGARVTGFDIDAEACTAARRNAHVALGSDWPIRFECDDAYRGAARYANRSVDLLLIDVEERESKREYVGLARSWLPKLASGAILLAHDPMVEKFEADFELFHEFVEGSEYVSDCVTLPLDFCGIDVARVDRTQADGEG